MANQNLTYGKTLKLSEKLKGKLYVLSNKNVAVLKRAYSKNLRGSRIINEHGCARQMQNLFGTCTMEVELGGDKVLVLFYNILHWRNHHDKNNSFQT